MIINENVSLTGFNEILGRAEERIREFEDGKNQYIVQNSR